MRNRVITYMGYGGDAGPGQLDGYRRGGKKRRRSGRRTPQQAKMAAAARACKGLSKGQFRACVRKRLTD